MFPMLGELHLLRKDSESGSTLVILPLCPWDIVTYASNWKLVGMKFLLQQQAKMIAEIHFICTVWQNCSLVPPQRTKWANALCKRQWPFKASRDRRIPYFSKKTISSFTESSGQGDFIRTHSATHICHILKDRNQQYSAYMQ